MIGLHIPAMPLPKREEQFQLVDPEAGFTSAVIRDSRRFVGRRRLILDCLSALNASQGMIAVFGKRGVGKSSLLRQIQSMALGDFSLPQRAGIYAQVPTQPRRYYTVYYQCDSLIANAQDLILRLCNDTDPEDGLLRLIPDAGKELVEFSRSDDAEYGLDLKLVKWGAKGTDLEKYGYRVANDPVQTSRNFVSAIVNNNNRHWSKRDSVLILLDEFDQIRDKAGLGSLIKSLSSPTVKFGICGVGRDLHALISDHASVGRLIQQGSLCVESMAPSEIREIFSTAQALFENKVIFDDRVISSIVDLSEGYPYFAQLIGKACIEERNRWGENGISEPIFERVLRGIRDGITFPTLEKDYSRAVGHSEDRAWLLALLAHQEEYSIASSHVHLKGIRGVAKQLDVANLDQNLPRLIDPDYGPVLVKDQDRPGIYEFVDPVFRAYVKLRSIGRSEPGGVSGRITCG
jgi:Cdc6-like AAA superfamily ATPase